MLDLPGRPSVDLTIAGSGTLADFAADIRLASDGVDRLAGPVTVPTGDEGEPPALPPRWRAIWRPLFLPDYQAFLGDGSRWIWSGARWSSGRVVLDRLKLNARALALDGSATVADDGLPEAFDLTAQIGTGRRLAGAAASGHRYAIRGCGGQRLFWPLTPTQRQRLDAARPTWRGLERDGLYLGRAGLTGIGADSTSVPGQQSVGGSLDLSPMGWRWRMTLTCSAHWAADLTGRRCFSGARAPMCCAFRW